MPKQNSSSWCCVAVRLRWVPVRFTCFRELRSYAPRIFVVGDFVFSTNYVNFAVCLCFRSSCQIPYFGPFSLLCALAVCWSTAEQQQQQDVAPRWRAFFSFRNTLSPGSAASFVPASNSNGSGENGASFVGRPIGLNCVISYCALVFVGLLGCVLYASLFSAIRLLWCYQPQSQPSSRSILLF